LKIATPAMPNDFHSWIAITLANGDNRFRVQVFSDEVKVSPQMVRVTPDNHYQSDIFR
jgi:hypothetical protein